MPANQQPKGSKVYVQAFFVCERIDYAPNGNITAHNIANRITIHSDAPQFPPVNWTMACHIRFIAEGGKTEHDVSVRCQPPGGGSTILFANHVRISAGPGGGAMLVNNITVPMKQSGKYWLDLLIDGTEASRYMLDVGYHRGGALN